MSNQPTTDLDNMTAEDWAQRVSAWHLDPCNMVDIATLVKHALTHYSSDLSAALERVEKRNQDLEQMVREVEWKGDTILGTDVQTCPSCEACETDGHTPDCRLAALLSQQQEETAYKKVPVGPQVYVFNADSERVAILGENESPALDALDDELNQQEETAQEVKE